MHCEFLYGVHSCGDTLTAEDVATLCALGHNAHVRIFGESLKQYELHRELQILHYLKHYGLYAIVDISGNKDARRIAQHVTELADCLITKGTSHNFVIEHDRPNEDDAARSQRILTSLRNIEAMQERGKNIRGYFCGAYTPTVRHSDIVLQAVIQQAKA